MEVAVNGIDGSGKSTFIQDAVGYFCRRGIYAAGMDIPYFRDTKGFGRLSPVFTWVGEWVEPRSRICFSIFVGVASLFYWVARWRLRGAEVLFVEHHPWVDVVPYARVYGSLPATVARIYRFFWPKPDALILLTLPVVEAHGRIRMRGRPLQWRQSLTRLHLLDELLKEAAGKIPARCIAEVMTPQQLFVEIWEPYIRSRAGHQVVRS